ncbi:MAG: energy transducer TonB [Bacteroidia bacterium]|nr:energy transducer TonB [Bacteroidia bacterium]
MTKRQENAFQRKLQRDPFADEAAEGFSEISPVEADEDIDRLGKRLNKRIAGRRKIIYYRIAASIAVLMIISSVYLFINRNKPASELSKGTFTPAGKEVIDSKKTAEPALQVSENAVVPTEVLSELEKENEIKDKSIPAITDAAPSGALAMAEKKDSVVLIAADQIAMADKQDSGVLITADLVAEQVAEVKEPILAEYKAETKNARIAGVEVTKAAYMEAVHTPPRPVTGKENFDKYISENLRRPANLADGDSAGVVVSFTVKISGAIDDLKVISSPGDEFSNEAKRLVLEGPAWDPAVSKGEKIDEETRLRIIFK